jgi:type II secretory pathway pseudopilin PulG
MRRNRRLGAFAGCDRTEPGDSRQHCPGPAYSGPAYSGPAYSGPAYSRPAYSRPAARSAGSKRRGVTLIELLIVILIVMMITAFSIPVIAPAIQGRRVREGARMFSTFLSAARGRAIETGRPAGVWLERMPAYPEAVQNIYMAESPPAYGGDFQDSTCVDLVCNAGGKCVRSRKDNPPIQYPNLDDRDWWNIVIPRTKSTFMADVWANPDPTEQTVVREGDQIKFEGNEYLYTLRTVKMSVDGMDGVGGSKMWWYILRGRNTRDGHAEGSYPPTNNEYRHSDKTYVIPWFDGRVSHGENAPMISAGGIDDTSAVGRRYQIFRQPVKMSTGGIQLPEGVVLDLNFSGMSDGTLVANVVTGTSAVDSQFTGTMPFHPHNDPADQTLNPYWGNPIYPNDRTPILIVFGSGGSVDRMYCQSFVWSRSQFSWQGLSPFGPITFLVGKLDKIFPNEVHFASTPPEEAIEMQSKKNWQDFENLWVTIDPMSGLITTSIVDDVADTGNDPSLVGNPANVRWARMSASRTRRNAGGR